MKKSELYDAFVDGSILDGDIGSDNTEPII